MLILLVLLILGVYISTREFHQLNMSNTYSSTLINKIRKEKLDLNVNTVYYRKRYNLEKVNGKA